MSHTMQLVVQVKPHYPHSFGESYPHLARNLDTITPGILGDQPSLFELCADLDDLLGRLEGTSLGRLLEVRAAELGRARRQIEELCADWKLEQADQLLYQIEDIFQTIESELHRG